MTSSTFALLCGKHPLKHDVSPKVSSQKKPVVLNLFFSRHGRKSKEIVQAEKLASSSHTDFVDQIARIYMMSLEKWSKIRSAPLPQRTFVSHVVNHLKHSKYVQDALREWIERQHPGTELPSKVRRPHVKKSARYLRYLQQTSLDDVPPAIHPVHYAIHQKRKPYISTAWVYTAVRHDNNDRHVTRYKTSQNPVNIGTESDNTQVQVSQLEQVREKSWSSRRPSNKRKPPSWHLERGPLSDTLQTNVASDSALLKEADYVRSQHTMPALFERLKLSRKSKSVDRTMLAANEASGRSATRGLLRATSVTIYAQTNPVKFKRRSRSLNNN